MSDAPAPPPAEVRLIEPKEIAIAIIALVYVTAVIVVREFFPESHDIWLVLTELITRAIALFFPMIDGHALVYRNILSDTRIDELRGIYASNRIFALAVAGIALSRVIGTAPQVQWYVWERFQFHTKWIFLAALPGLFAAPVAIWGLFFGFADENFFEFAFGVILVDTDVYYYLDFLMVLVVAWQFLFFFPAAVYFMGKVGYGHWFASWKWFRGRSR